MEIRDTNYKKANNVPLKSPIALGGFFLHFLRIRFNPANNLPWQYNPDILQTGIIIEAGTTVENEVRNNRPAIWVNVGPARIGNIVVGDKAYEPLNISGESSYARVDMNITINCESSKRAESHLIGWLVMTSFVATQDVLRTQYQLANMGPFDLAPPMPSKKDKEMFVSSMTFGVSYELTFKQIQVQTFIKDLNLVLDIVTQDGRDVTGFLTEIYLR